jgi:peptidoglycan/xylan/chitin deacetylase (PgdA/CDA1 family)
VLTFLHATLLHDALSAPHASDISIGSIFNKYKNGVVVNSKLTAFLAWLILASTNVSAQEIGLSDLQNKWSGSFNKTSQTNGESSYTASIEDYSMPSYIEHTFEEAVSFERKFVRVKFKVSKREQLSGIELRLSSDESGYDNFFAIATPLFTDPDFNTVQNNSWMTYTYTMGEAKAHGTPDLSKIKRLGFYIGGKEIEVEFSLLKIEEALSSSIVTFTFDDGYIDHYEAAQVMGKYDLPGTAYIMPREINLENYLTTAHVLEMKNSFGWDISSHHKTPIVDFSHSELDNEFNYTLGYLNALNSFDEALHFAYPLGKQNRKTTLPLIKRTFRTARLAGGGAETLPPADWHMLRTFNVMPHISAEELMKRVIEAEAQGEWLILMFHHFTKDPAPTDPLVYNIDEFEKFCQLIKEHNSLVMTVDQVHKVFEQ